MGRHSDPDPRWFWQSFAAAVGKALLALAIVAAAFLLLTQVNRKDFEGPLPTASPEPEGPAVISPSPGEARLDPAAPALEPRAASAGERAGDEAAGSVTVQVLNASGDAALTEAVVAVLEELGYVVVAEGRAARGYEETTVFWSAGRRAEAVALRRADPRFGVLERNERLDASIDLHVVIGADWTSAD